MEKISRNACGLNTLCRLCLRSDVTLIDIFWFSDILKNQVANVIMMCAPIQITKRDNMPNFICQLCYTHLEKNHQFQMQVLQSDRTLRHCLQGIHVSDKQTELEVSVQMPSEDPLIHNTNADITMKSVFDTNVNCEEMSLMNFNSANKINKEISLEAEIKGDDTLDNLFKSNGCEISCEDSNMYMCGIKIGAIYMHKDINGEKEVSGTFNSTNEINDGSSLNSEIRNEPMDDNSEYVDDPVIASSNSDDSEISCKNTKTDIGHIWGNFANLRSAEVTEYFDICEDKSKSISASHYKYKKPTGNKYQCDVCDKCFFKSSALKIHNRVHTGEKPYQCDFCKRKFSSSSALKVHNRLHTGEKPYQCDVCKKCFITSSNLKRHNYVHTGERPYQCDTCKKCFLSMSHLKRHNQVHTGIKPYHCDVCSTYFSRPSTLKAHLLKHST